MTVTFDDLIGILIPIFIISVVSLVVNFIYFNVLFDRQTDVIKRLNKIRRYLK